MMCIIWSGSYGSSLEIFMDLSFLVCEIEIDLLSDSSNNTVIKSKGPKPGCVDSNRGPAAQTQLL